MWNIARVTCAWTQDMLDAGPTFSLYASCYSLDMFVDDVALI